MQHFCLPAVHPLNFLLDVAGAGAQVGQAGPLDFGCLSACLVHGGSAQDVPDSWHHALLIVFSAPSLVHQMAYESC